MKARTFIKYINKVLFAALLLFSAAGAHAQYVQVTNLTGTATYSGIPVTISRAGTTGSGGGMCLLAPLIPYNSGGGGVGGTITFTLGAPVYAIMLRCERIHTGEYVHVMVNGVAYYITASNMLSYTDCAGTYFTSLSGGDVIGPPSGKHSQGTFVIHNCSGINSFSVYCNGTDGGSDFYAYINPTACNNGPVCAGDTIKLNTISDSTIATYSWSGPGGFTSTLQNPVIPLIPLADSGIYKVIQTIAGVHDTITTRVVLKKQPVIVAGSNSPLCTGSVLLLTATPDSLGETFAWSGPNTFTSTLENPSRVPVTIPDSGTYKVIATWNGCKDSAEVRVDIDSTPVVPVAGSNSPLCEGSTLFLTATDATSGVSYVWSGPGGFSSPLQNPSVAPATTAASGTYSVTAALGSCTASSSTLVTVNPVPVAPTLGSNSHVCSGNSLNLTATGSPAASYSWTGPNGFTSALQNPVISPATLAATGTYSVVETLGGCSSPVATISVVVDSTPVTPTIGSNSPLCAGFTLLLTSFGATTTASYSWSGPAGFTSTLQNPSITAVTAAAAGTYTVSSILGACRSSATTVVVVNPAPAIPVLGSNAPLCSGNSLNLTAATTVGAIYSWTGPNGFTSALQNPSIAPASTLATGTYSFTATLGSCTTEIVTIYALVDSGPATPVILSNSPGVPSICEGDTLKLYGSDSTAGVSFSWSGPNTFTSTLQNPVVPNAPAAATGVYTLTVDQGGCTSAAVGTVSITPKPLLIVGSNSPVCTGVTDTLFLTATSAPGATFSWTGPHVFFSFAQNPFRTPVISDYGGIYQVTAQVALCKNTVNDTVVVHDTPGPPWMSWLTYCQYYDAPPLQSNGTNILWYPVSNIIGLTGSPTAPALSTADDTVLWFYSTQTVQGCESAVDSFKVTINPKPEVTAFGDTTVCPRDSAVLVAIDTDPVAHYQWTPSMYLNNATAATVTVRPITDVHYTVVAGNQFGCTDTAHVNVAVYPQAIINIGDSVTIYPGENYQLSPQTNCYVFEWTPTIGLDNPYVSNPVASPEASTRYIVYGVTYNGCRTSDSIYIHVADETLLTAPNAFAPGTGPNSLFKILKRGAANLTYFRIWDRWGVKVFETTDIDKGWDGEYNAKPQPLGVYVYEIGWTAKTGRTYTKHGNVTLIR